MQTFSIPFTQFSPVVPSCETIVQYHNQDVGCCHGYRGDKKNSSLTTWNPFIAKFTPLCHWSLARTNLFSIYVYLLLSVKEICIFPVLYINKIIQYLNFWECLFFTHHNSLKIYPDCCVSITHYLYC